ncbi:oxidoreductase [Clavulina sp. PMI_390]|nr:oxidoreductase [Clavulina sp. PMI_390]
MFGNSWSAKGKHCYVSGGSSGLGLELAKLLVKDGAHVSIVARNEQKLSAAQTELEGLRVSPGQQIHSYSFSLYALESSTAALKAASAPHGGKCPDALFLCAGASKPQFLLEMTEDDIKKGMDDAYWVQAWTAIAGSRMMVEQGIKGKIVLVGSTLSYFSFVGFASYSPGKYALRGLADTLRSEYILYDIAVQMYFPNTMLTPGYDTENLTKPALTKAIEDGDTPVTPATAAKSMYAGIRSGEPHISGDFITSVFRASTRGSTPYANVFMENIYGFIGWIGLPIWRRVADGMVKKHKAEHREWLAQHGIVPGSELAAGSPISRTSSKAKPDVDANTAGVTMSDLSGAASS